MFKILKRKSEQHHGNHVVGDFVWNVANSKLDDNQLAHYIFGLMEKAILRTKMTIVHKQLCILGLTEKSPPGFTSVILIDESHITSHCYADRGWLAIDVFTCGSTNPVDIMDYIVQEIKIEYPTLECTFKKNHHRFHYNL